MRPIHFFVLMLLAASAVLPAHAQQMPTGRWTTIDDATGKSKSVVEIYQARDGSYAGKVVEVLDTKEGPNPLCIKCTGGNKDKPIKGMVILWGLKPDGSGHWSGGRVLDPENGIFSALLLAMISIGISVVAGIGGTIRGAQQKAALFPNG